MSPPITQRLKLSSIFKAAEKGFLDGKRLSSWAEELLLKGVESDAIIEALASPDMHWQEVKPLFIRICLDIGVSKDPIHEAESIKNWAIIEEYKLGITSAFTVVREIKGMREKIGFPSPVILEIDASTGETIYKTEHKSLFGKELEAEIIKHLVQSGITKQAHNGE
ncbi:hypothetical protein [Agaribacterium sp. ZY112]|uniref:hypothetical protein n=1 Tax=Agaribacterium sp. ZY112 TaxID=3233574 RepID=UPI003525C036